jgi:predicted dinucleotide-binding enzyme
VRIVIEIGEAGAGRTVITTDPEPPAAAVREAAEASGDAAVDAGPPADGEQLEPPAETAIAAIGRETCWL